MTQAQQQVKNLVKIGDWAKSCKTAQQLENVENFFYSYVAKMPRLSSYIQSDLRKIVLNIGIVSGIILSIKKLKFSTVVITSNTFKNISYDKLNNLALRSDIENDNIGWSDEYITKLFFEGYVGNRPDDFEGEHHEDDTWAIDLRQDGDTVESYLYTSEFEYLEDIKLLQQ